jgi:hypothetical protein
MIQRKRAARALVVSKDSFQSRIGMGVDIYLVVIF